MGLFWCPAKMRETLKEKLVDVKSTGKIEGLQIKHIPEFDDELFVPPTFI